MDRTSATTHAQIRLMMPWIIGLTLVLCAPAPSAPAANRVGPDPTVLAQLSAVESPEGGAVLVGRSVEAGQDRPQRIFPFVAVFATSEDASVTVRELRITGPDGKVRGRVKPNKRLGPPEVRDMAPRQVLVRLADHGQEHTARLAKSGYFAFDGGVPVRDLRLADGTATTFTVSAELEEGGERTTVSLSLPVKIAALPSASYWSAGDGHVHSTWSDGLWSLASQVSYAGNNGQGFVIFADHWKGIWATSGGNNANWGAYQDDCTFKQSAYGMPVLPGTEIMAAADKGHALAYALSRGTVPPRDEYHEPAALLASISNHTPGSSYATVAHPFRWWPNTPWSDWNATGFQTIELMSNEPQASSVTQDKWFALLRRDTPSAIAGGRFVVGMANTDAHHNGPGDNGINWLRSATSPLTRTAVWDAIRLGRVSASGRKDLGYFSLNGTQQGGLVPASSTTRLTFSITQKPVTGRKCTEISIRDRDNAAIWSVSNPASQTYTRTIAPPASDTFYVVKMVFASTSGTEYSHVWCNPVFVDRR